LALTAGLLWAPSQARAAGVTVSASDFSLAISAANGTSSSTLSSSQLAGFFNMHRCLCPETLTATFSLNSSSQAATDIGTSTIAVSFLLGNNCSTSASSTACVALGQGTLTSAQSSVSATFTSSQVFQLASAGGTVSCTSLASGSTTLSMFLAQDGLALSAPLQFQLPVITTVVAPPTAVTALGSNNGILVGWTAPSDTSQVAGYQVLCLPRPPAASTASYDSCEPDSSTTSTGLSAADQTQVCSAEVDPSATSVRLSGLVNGTSYTVAVGSIDWSGGVSVLSPSAVAIPQPTLGFYDKYKDAGGAASGCSISRSPRAAYMPVSWILLVAASIIVRSRRSRPRRLRTGTNVLGALAILLSLGATARAQDSMERFDSDWPSDSLMTRKGLPPDWGFELGISLYRPAVDSEFSNGAHPYADTFGSSRHLLSEAELDRYLARRFGTWGVGLRCGYYKVTGAAFYADGKTPSGDETSLRLIPLSLSGFYRADELPGLRSVPLIPYVKAGLDGVWWTETSTGESASPTGFTPGWHVAAGIVLGLNFLGVGNNNATALPDPFALFFEWNYAAINGLGFGNKLHVGDNTWFAGVVFDL
jgi:hypothetical protein